MSDRRPAATRSDETGLKQVRWTGSRPSLEERLGRAIEPQPDGCWIFRGDPETYGMFTDGFRGTHVNVHRFVYETLVGRIDDGLYLHHKCFNRGCCNPEHLEPVTPKEHAARHRTLLGGER